MSNWEYASEDELEAAREAYSIDDPKHPDYAETMAELADAERELKKEGVQTLNEALEAAQEPMRALNAALVAAQSEFPPIERSKTVNVRTREQGTYSFSYAPLDAILEKTRPALTKHGLALTQQLTATGLRTELRHKDGAKIGGTFPLPHTPTSAQQLGSLLTYLRRYAIVALLGVAAEDDDDAGQSEFKAPKQKPGEPPFTSEGQRKLMYALRDKLIKAGKLDEETFNAQVFDDYGKRASQLTSNQTSEVIDRLNKALEKHHERSS
jgi:ERF superfamily